MMNIKDIKQLYYFRIIISIKRGRIKFIPNKRIYHTRRNEKIIFPISRKTIKQQNSNFLVPRLSTENINTCSYNAFKIKLKYLFANGEGTIFSEVFYNYENKN